MRYYDYSVNQLEEYAIELLIEFDKERLVKTKPKEILNAITDINKHIDKMIKAVEDEIRLIAEYRMKVIADVVTGQMDVRNEVIPEYDNAKDNESDDELKNDDKQIEESED